MRARSEWRAGAARDPLRAGQRHACHRGGFDGQRHEILGLKIMHMRLAAGARDNLSFHAQSPEIIRQPSPAEHRIKTLRELVDYYDRRFDAKYTEREKQDLVNFLGVL